MIRALAFIALATPALAEGPQCGPFQDVASGLFSGFGEQRRFVGLNMAGGATALFANEKTGTWTVVIVGPDGNACLVDSGESGGFFAAEPEGIAG